MVPAPPLPSAGTMEWSKVANESGLAEPGGRGGRRGGGRNGEEKEEEEEEGKEEQEEKSQSWLLCIPSVSSGCLRLVSCLNTPL